MISIVVWVISTTVGMIFASAEAILIVVDQSLIRGYKSLFWGPKYSYGLKGWKTIHSRVFAWIGSFNDTQILLKRQFFLPTYYLEDPIFLECCWIAAKG
jgi:hypothetical protein